MLSQKSEIRSQNWIVKSKNWELGTGNWEWDRSWKDIISQSLLEMLNKSILKLSWHINYGNASLVTFKHFFSFSRVHQYELPVQKIIISSFQLMAINWVALFSSVSFVMVEALFNNKSSHVLLLHDTQALQKILTAETFDPPEMWGMYRSTSLNAVCEVYVSRKRLLVS